MPVNPHSALRTTMLPLLSGAGVGLLIAAAGANAAHWPQFRGPTGLGYTDDKNLPLHWNAKSNLNVAWKSPLPKCDNPYSSPVVWGDRVFVTTVVNKIGRAHV